MAHFGLGDAQPAGSTWPGWGAYAWAVADLLVRESVREEGGQLGIEGVIASEIPVGAGLSSSAEVARSPQLAPQAPAGATPVTPSAVEEENRNGPQK